VQTKKPYYKEYFEATEPMMLKPKEIKFVNRVAGYDHARTK
jgi:quinol monooxygenase YgiN